MHPLWKTADNLCAPQTKQQQKKKKHFTDLKQLIFVIYIYIYI